jgi:hypothetical protein
MIRAIQIRAPTRRDTASRKQRSFRDHVCMGQVDPKRKFQVCERSAASEAKRTLRTGSRRLIRNCAPQPWS